MLKPIGDKRETQLRAFFCATLCNAKDYKHRWPAETSAPEAAWPTRFERFLRDFNGEFTRRVAQARADIAEVRALEPPLLWRTDGDAIMFMELVYPDQAMRHAALSSSLRTFVDLVESFDRDYLADGLGVRGCVWTAGFPLRNRPVRFSHGAVAALDDELEHLANGEEDARGATRSEPVTVTTYVGRDMDLGFALNKRVPDGRVGASLDLADFVMQIPPRRPTSVWHVGWDRYEGVFGGMPYPTLLLTTSERPAPRHPWEPDGPGVPDAVRALLSQESALTRGGFTELADELRAQHRHMIRPYASPRDIDAGHETALNKGNAFRALAINADAQAGHVASAAEAKDITLDELNHLLLVLQERPDEAQRIARVLKTVATHPTYERWAAEAQYDEKLYRLDSELSFADDADRRLLEAKGLVDHDSILRVKLNHADEQVFLTDGLWIPAAFRTFSFVDESELIRREVRAQGWEDWATCVIDPACGAGHNALMHSGLAETRRYGFDRNARASTLASINALLTGTAAARFGVNDVRSGLPPVFSNSKTERVLILGNMPFALSPKRHSIARSSEGGRYGYELTLDLLDALSKLEGFVRRGTEMRSVVLMYTVGNAQTNTWHVPQSAIELFGADRVKWHLWDDEKLWRVNGKKEQPNPMPVANLALKADCRFHVRDDSQREEVRRGYDLLARDLESQGLHDLAYGVLTIEHQSKQAR